MSEAQARRLAVMMTEKQRQDFLILARIIQNMEDKKPAANGQE